MVDLVAGPPDGRRHVVLLSCVWELILFSLEHGGGPGEVDVYKG